MSAVPAGFLFWFVLTGLGTAAVAVHGLNGLAAQFDAQTRTIHRVPSQRADQHDAHLTSLAAALQRPGGSTVQLRAIADAVVRLNPQILAVDVIGLDPGPVAVFTTGDTGSALPDPAALARGLAPGQSTVAPNDGAYRLVKQVAMPTGRPGALVLSIDAGRFVETDEAPPADVRLADGSGRTLVALRDRLTHHCDILEAGNESWWFRNRS